MHTGIPYGTSPYQAVTHRTRVLSILHCSCSSLPCCNLHQKLFISCSTAETKTFLLSFVLLLSIMLTTHQLTSSATNALINKQIMITILSFTIRSDRLSLVINFLISLNLSNQQNYDFILISENIKARLPFPLCIKF